VIQAAKHVFLAALILLLALAAAAVCYLTMDRFAVDRMERYFRYEMFDRDLSRALNGGEVERVKYYALADRFPLDGEYTEAFTEGLDKLVKRFGAGQIRDENYRSGMSRLGIYLTEAEDPAQ
jgi:hypothetical protein